jgi:hypothetical protein
MHPGQDLLKETTPKYPPRLHQAFFQASNTSSLTVLGLISGKASFKD